MNEQGHWLPPDNVQEHPYWAVARRTSPTNIGMALLADLAAHDLGHLSTSGWLARIKGTLNTLTRMERHRGHFYNWYETPTLQPIEPRYVSSVDSGNLWGSLIVLRNGLEELRERPVVATRLFEGLQDTLEVIERLRSAEDAFAFSDQFDACLAHCASSVSHRCPEARGTFALAFVAFVRWPQILRSTCRKIRPR